LESVDLGGRRIIKKKTMHKNLQNSTKDNNFCFPCPIMAAVINPEISLEL
jgi:hypothetical protein